MMMMWSDMELLRELGFGKMHSKMPEYMNKFLQIMTKSNAI